MAPNVASKRRDLLWPFLLAGTITWCSGRAVVQIDLAWLSIDKIGHFAIYGALATAVVRLPALSRWPLLGAWWAILLASAYGLGDEVRQSFTIVRLFEWADWVADTLGAALAVWLYLRRPRYRRWLETSIRFKRAKPGVGNLTTEERT